MKILEIFKSLYSRPLVLFAAALAAGIGLGSKTDHVFWVGAVVIAFFGGFSIYKSKTRNTAFNRLFVLITILLSFLIGVIRIRDICYETGLVPKLDGGVKNSVIEGIVSGIEMSQERYLITITDPVVKPGVETDGFGSAGYLPDGSKVLLYSDSIGTVGFGDRIRSKGTLYTFQPATNLGQFDFEKYYNAKGIYYKLYADEISSVSINDSFFWKVKGFFFDISLEFQNGLSRIFDSEKHGILSAMLAGNRSELDEDTKDLYKKIGIAHVLSISGLHITLIGIAVFELLLKLTKHLKFSVLISLIFIISYGVFTGFSVSTQRAVIMLFCQLTARIIGKAYDGQSAAAFAALIILTFSPAQLFESGFLLSFTAVFGIFAGNEIRSGLKIKNPVLVYCIPAVFAMTSTFPIILSNYYSFSPYSIPANLILLPFMSVIIICGLISGIFGMIFVNTGTIFFLDAGMVTGGPSAFFLSVYKDVSEFLLDLPGADIITGCPETVGCIIFYIIFFVLVCVGSLYAEKLKKKLPGLISVLLTAFSIFVMFFAVLYRDKDSKFYLANMDVGQGLAVYMEADDTNILADGGSSNVKNVGKYRIEPFLLYRGVSVLDYCFISHTDEDHISGIRELIENGRIRIKTMIFGVNTSESDPLIVLAQENGIDVVFAAAGDIISKEGYIRAEESYSKEDEPEAAAYGKDSFVIKVISPDSNTIYEDKNQGSIVFLLTLKDLSMLFTGDSDMYSEAEYVKYLKDGKKVNILECPHHGSKYSCSELLLESVRPQLTIISCSKTNKYGHPASETLERLERIGSKVFTTPDCGMVTVKADGDGKYRIQRYKN